jgi:hypothetical protein
MYQMTCSKALVSQGTARHELFILRKGTGELGALLDRTGVEHTRTDKHENEILNPRSQK